MKQALVASKYGLFAITLAVLASPAQLKAGESEEASGVAPLRLATGQYITPLAPHGAVQQFLNPGLLNYPNFVASEAVRSQLSPDGSTLAILCAGQNSLYDATGNLDVANSTQYVFLYDVTGAHAKEPALTQVIQQTNAHVGLVFSPDGTLYAAGGKDDVFYTYTKTGTTWSLSKTIKLTQFPVETIA